MLFLLLSAWLGTALAGDRDCVTTDNSWRYVTASDGASWRLIHDKNVLSENSSATPLAVEWHTDTRRDFSSDDPNLALFAIEATVRHPGGEPMADGLAAEQRLDLRCAETGGPPSAKPAPAAKPAPVAPDAPVPADESEPVEPEPKERAPVIPPPPLPVPEPEPDKKKKGKRR